MHVRVRHSDYHYVVLSCSGRIDLHVACHLVEVVYDAIIYVHVLREESLGRGLDQVRDLQRSNPYQVWYSSVCMFMFVARVINTSCYRAEDVPRFESHAIMFKSCRCNGTCCNSDMVQ